MNTQTLQLPLILPAKPDCDRCVSRLQEDLQRIKGIQRATVETSSSSITLSYDPNIITLSRIETEAQQAGAALAARIDHQTLELKDLDCPDCAASIEKAVNQIPGVLWAGANFAAAQLHAEFEKGRVSLDQIARAVEMHGVRACPINGSAGAASGANKAKLPSWWIENRKLIAAISSVLLTALGAAFAMAGMHWPAIVMFGATVVVGGWSTARAALASMRLRSADMNVLMSIAVLGATGIGDWFEAATVVALYNVGIQLQAGSIERTRRSIKALIKLSPKRATVVRDSEIELAVEDVQAGDIVRVKPGERIALDGVIVEGASAVNQAAITGESMPSTKGPGDPVFAGTLNGTGAIDFRATHSYKDTTLARIIHRVEEAQAQRAPTQQFIDQFASKYTPAVVAIAIAVAVIPPAILTLVLHPTPYTLHPWGEWFHRALSLLIIACPCALVISTPVAFVTAIGAASKNGVLIKGGVFLEQVGKLKALLYDKTGTLTHGKFSLNEIVPLDGSSADQVLSIAASIEARSEHPLAAAFVEASKARNLAQCPVEEFESIPGAGARARISGSLYTISSPRYLDAAEMKKADCTDTLAEFENSGKTVVVLSNSHGIIALFALSDSVKKNAARSVSAATGVGIRHQSIVSGDNEQVTRAVAAATGVTAFSSGLLPDQKLALVESVRNEYGAVGMVGDGINDAPALAAADVGISMGAAASETAIETADIAILGEDLSRLPWLINLGRRTNAIVRQNVAFSLATKGILLFAAAFIGMPLWLAVLGDVGVSLLVTLNALRLVHSPGIQ